MFQGVPAREIRFSVDVENRIFSGIELCQFYTFCALWYFGSAPDK